MAAKSKQSAEKSKKRTHSEEFDISLTHSLWHLDSLEEALMKEVARLRNVVSNVSTVLSCASKQAQKDRAVASAIKILNEEVGNYEG